MSNEILTVDELVDKPYCAYVVGEMGVGKTTFLRLLKAYEAWLQKRFGLEAVVFNTFEEEKPPCWDDYIHHKDAKIPHESIYQAQLWFARQKINMIRAAMGLDLQNQVMAPDPRSLGIYFVDRTLHEDFYVFAQGLERLFPKGMYEQYIKEVEKYLLEIPPPDLVIRLQVETPEISQARVLSRGWGEQLRLSRYHQMAEQYEDHIDPWIEEMGVPIVPIRTDYPHFDFKDPYGQNYFLTTLLTGLHNNGVWLPDYHRLPVEMLLYNGKNS